MNRLFTEIEIQMVFKWRKERSASLIVREKSKIKILEDNICYLFLADVCKPDMIVLGDKQSYTLLLLRINCFLWRTILQYMSKFQICFDQVIPPLKNLCRNIHTHLKRPVYKIICSSITCNWKQNVNNLYNLDRRLVKLIMAHSYIECSVAIKMSEESP